MFLIFSEGQLKWMSDALVPVMHNLRSTITVEIRLFTTAAAVEKDPFSLDSPVEDKSLSLPIAQGRPDIRSLINNEIANATGDIAVNGMLLYCTPLNPLIMAPVCGTGGLAKSVKGALRNPRFMDILRGGPSVTLHLEAFGIVSTIWSCFRLGCSSASSDIVFCVNDHTMRTAKINFAPLRSHSDLFLHYYAIIL